MREQRVTPTAAAPIAEATDLLMRPWETQQAWQERTGCATIGDAIDRINGAFAEYDRKLAEARKPQPCEHPRKTAGGTCLSCFEINV